MTELWDEMKQLREEDYFAFNKCDRIVKNKRDKVVRE